MSERLIELRVENQKLKEQVQDLEKKILSLVGMVKFEPSGGIEAKNVMIYNLIELFNTTKKQLNIVTPKVDQFFSNELKKLAQKGLQILLIMNERGNLLKEYQQIYDDLKLTSGIKVINNPNVRFMMAFNNEQAIYAGGALDKEELEKSILIQTIVNETSKLRKIAEIFSLMLPSFMRT